jgi:hypothetical protein
VEMGGGVFLDDKRQRLVRLDLSATRFARDFKVSLSSVFG